eukprot:m.412903 g.412903  ORF g.412903 m.412903 type:complete len:667 (-) comp21259_c0_seq1:106-2106(-)
MSTSSSFLLEALPEARAAPWRNDKAASEYLLKLAATPQSDLVRLPELLKSDKEQTLEDTQKLAFENYKTFIHTAHCTTDIFKDFTTIENHTNGLLEKVPDFSHACRTFLAEAEQINAARRRNTLTLQHHSQVLEILEIPQLMDTCVRNAYYEEALQLQAHVVQLKKRHADIAIIQSIANDVETYARQMQDNLLTQLRSDVQLPACLKVIGYLRRLNVYSELQLRVQFLQARDAWLQKVLNGIPTADAYVYITKTVETCRVHFFDIITQYKAVFSHPLEKSTGGGADGSQGLLSGWILQRVADFLQVLSDHLPRMTDRFNAVLGQCMHFALSLGRVGLDFRSLLPPLFESAILNYFTWRVELAAAEFSDQLPTLALVSHPSIPDADDSGSGGGGLTDAPIAPLSLMAHPVLATLTNSLLAALNDLRECAPLAIAADVARHLSASLVAVAGHLRTYFESHADTLDQRDRHTFDSLTRMYVDTLVPCMVRCVGAVYADAVFQSGSALVVSPPAPASLVDRMAIARLLAPFCTQAQAFVQSGGIDVTPLPVDVPATPSAETGDTEAAPEPREAPGSTADAPGTGTAAMEGTTAAPPNATPPTATPTIATPTIATPPTVTLTAVPDVTEVTESMAATDVPADVSVPAAREAIAVVEDVVDVVEDSVVVGDE